MSRNNIVKQINALQKSIESLEKERKQGHFEPRKTRTPDRLVDEENPNPPIRTGKINPDTGTIDYDKSMEKGQRKRWPTNPPSRLKDTKEDRERPISPQPEVREKPPYSPMEDVGKAEGDTAPATESTQRSADLARRRNEEAEDMRIDEMPEEPVIQRKPPYSVKYANKDVELDLKGDAITKNSSQDYRGINEGIPEHVKNRDKTKAEIGRGNVKRQGPEGIRVPNKPTPKEDNFEAMRKSLLKLMQYGGI